MKSAYALKASSRVQTYEQMSTLHWQNMQRANITLFVYNKLGRVKVQHNDGTGARFKMIRLSNHVYGANSQQRSSHDASHVE